MKKNRTDGLRLALAQEIQQALNLLWPEHGTSLESLYYLIVLPPQKEMGHLAWGAFPIAKVLKLAPPVIAQKVTEQMRASESILFTTVENLGPYVNFRFSGRVLTEKIIQPLLSGEIKKQILFSNPFRTMVEFSQPNTHKELHVGHMRNACLGDSLVRMMRYSGIPVISTTFPGDVGTHVAKCLWYLKYHNQEPLPKEHRGEWLGRMYSKAHLFLEERVGTSSETSDREALSLILRQIESRSGEFYELWKETRQWSLDLMNEVYQWCDIQFDHWYWESDVDSDSVKTIKRYYSEGRLIESEGALGMDLTEENLGFCVLLKSDGNGLYSTKDIELARRKFEDHHIEKSIYVVDMRQALHFKQVFASLKRLGFAYADQCFHLQYNFVELPDGAMSSRKGNIVPLTQLVQQMEEHVRQNYLKRYVGEWSEQEIAETARRVAQGAIKYGMLRMDPNKKIVFDLAEWLKIDGESGPYIQYAYARIQSLLRRFPASAGSLSEFSTQGSAQGSTQVSVLSSTRGLLLTHSSELDLLILLGQFHSIVTQAVEVYRPNVLCNYLYEVARQFSYFYHECSIAHAETIPLREDRLILAQATALVLNEGLKLLGIPVPEKM